MPTPHGAPFFAPPLPRRIIAMSTCATWDPQLLNCSDTMWGFPSSALLSFIHPTGSNGFPERSSLERPGMFPATSSASAAVPASEKALCDTSRDVAELLL